jgi:hypothetical protein
VVSLRHSRGSWLVAALWLASARTAAGQSPPLASSRPYAPFISLQLDGGVARNFERGRWGLLGGGGAGVGLYNGDHVWDFTADVRGVRADQRAIAISGARTTVENGLGLHAGVIWDLDRRAPGMRVGLSLSLLNLEGAIIHDGGPTTHLSLFVRVPVGFLAYLARGGRR